MLKDEGCVPCTGEAPRVTEADRRELEREVPDWRVVTVDGEQRLRRTFRFDDFRSALEFADRVGAAAEKAGHHPLLEVTWGRATVSWWTHAIGGLHRNDFIMAARTDELAAKD